MDVMMLIGLFTTCILVVCIMFELIVNSRCYHNYYIENIVGVDIDKKSAECAAFKELCANHIILFVWSVCFMICLMNGCFEGIFPTKQTGLIILYFSIKGMERFWTSQIGDMLSIPKKQYVTDDT